MAGTNPAFSPTVFRNAIRFAMNMGLPNKSADKATFRWTTVKDYTHEDSGGVPFDLTSAPTAVQSHVDVQVPVAWAFHARPSQSVSTEAGEFDNTRVEITILDEEYAQVQGADLVLLGGNTYEIEFVSPPQGLFEVDVFTIYAAARDES
jgi:hypothetical protein